MECYSGIAGIPTTRASLPHSRKDYAESPILLRLLQNSYGTVQVEFLITFVPVFLLYLASVQMGLLFAGDLLVQHAANMAARASAVVLPDDPNDYDNVPIYDASDQGGGGHEMNAMVNFTSGQNARAGVGGDRIGAIRSAAALALMGISPPVDSLGLVGSVARSLGAVQDERASRSAVDYARSAVAVSFPNAPGGNTFRNQFQAQDRLTVRVSYLMHCGVPVVNRLICEDFASLRSGNPSALVGFEQTERGRQARRRRLGDLTPNMNELNFAERPNPGGRFERARFYLLRGESQFPMQGAEYNYAR